MTAKFNLGPSQNPYFERIIQIDALVNEQNLPIDTPPRKLAKEGVELIDLAVRAIDEGGQLGFSNGLSSQIDIPVLNTRGNVVFLNKLNDTQSSRQEFYSRFPHSVLNITKSREGVSLSWIDYLYGLNELKNTGLVNVNNKMHNTDRNIFELNTPHILDFYFSIPTPGTQSSQHFLLFMLATDKHIFFMTFLPSEIGINEKFLNYVQEMDEGKLIAIQNGLLNCLYKKLEAQSSTPRR